MANAPFTRDEVILALDVLYCSGEERLSPDSYAIKELSRILQNLPIHPLENRNPDFRNPNGVFRQISAFRATSKKGKKDPHVARLFYSISLEYQGRLEELHRIADAIRRNEVYFYRSNGFVKAEGFPEGFLLESLHEMVEQRDGETLLIDGRCSVCQLQPQTIYITAGTLLEQHLVVSPVDMDGGSHYRKDDFITVCPNCHAALHRFRPWLKKNESEAVLR